ncbi:RNA-binding protein [Streptomyces sp. M-16]|uniref:ASCH domain-containing protein n=1 Tax=Streptomyces sp. M-16 TaxID=3233040 RepID=UPI003F9936FC
MARFLHHFELVAAGTKTIGVLIKYPNLAGLTIRLRIEDTDETCDVEVLHVTEYPDFEALLDGEGSSSVSPTATHHPRLVNIHTTYSPEKETLAVMAIVIQRMAA